MVLIITDIITDIISDSMVVPGIVTEHVGKREVGRQEAYTVRESVRLWVVLLPRAGLLVEVERGSRLVDEVL